MTFAATNPNISGIVNARYFDSIAARDAAVPPASGVAGLIAWVEDTRSFYMLAPKATGANPLEWKSWTTGEIGNDNTVLRVLGGIAFQVRIIGDTNAIVNDDDYAIVFDTTLTAARTVTLPAASVSTAGRQLVIKSKNAVNGVNTIAIAGVDGGTSTISTAYGSRTVIDDGTGWSLIASV